MWAVAPCCGPIFFHVAFSPGFLSYSKSSRTEYYTTNKLAVLKIGKKKAIIIISLAEYVWTCLVSSILFSILIGLKWARVLRNVLEKVHGALWGRSYSTSRWLNGGRSSSGGLWGLVLCPFTNDPPFIQHDVLYGFSQMYRRKDKELACVGRIKNKTLMSRGQWTRNEIVMEG